MRIAISEFKYVHLSFNICEKDCPPATINSIQLPHQNSVKYLGMHLDHKLTWKKTRGNKRD